jgi:hypothetical protein
MFTNHIFNIAQIKNRLKGKKKYAEENNLYEKINMLFKGGVICTPELIEDIKGEIKEQSTAVLKYLDEKKKIASKM